jgi:predicted Rossmann-fold nucleotide-binding protein
MPAWSDRASMGESRTIHELFSGTKNDPGNGGPGMKSICVFCGSSPGRDQKYRDAARALGQALARAKVRLVYGG